MHGGWLHSAVTHGVSSDTPVQRVQYSLSLSLTVKSLAVVGVSRRLRDGESPAQWYNLWRLLASNTVGQSHCVVYCMHQASLHAHCAPHTHTHTHTHSITAGPLRDAPYHSALLPARHTSTHCREMTNFDPPYWTKTIDWIGQPLNWSPANCHSWLRQWEYIHEHRRRCQPLQLIRPAACTAAVTIVLTHQAKEAVVLSFVRQTQI